MKRCLTCRRVYSDESLKFCRDDGEPLVVSTVADESAETVHLSMPPHAVSTADAPTRVFEVGEAAHLTVPPANVETGKLEESRAAGISRVALRARRRVLAALLAVPVLAAGAALVIYLNPRNAKVPIESIAVLPFAGENKVVELDRFPEDSQGQQRTKRQLERNKETEDLSSLLTRDITNNLAQLPSLRVISRTTVSRYKEKDVNLVAAGRELGVHAVFSGEVFQLGDLLTINVELVDARHDEQIWGRSYQYNVAEFAAKRQEISHHLAECLQRNRQGKRCEN